MDIFKVGKASKIYEPSIILKENRQIIIGEKCSIGQYTFIAARKLVMMEGAEISPSVVLSGGGDITLGKYSALSFGVKLIPATFSRKAEYMNDMCDPDKTEIVRGSITLGEGAYVGANAVICVSKKNRHIQIGKHAVIGALTYVDRNVPDYAVVHKGKT